MYTRVQWYEKLVREVAQEFDFDLCLPVQMLKLK